MRRQSWPQDLAEYLREASLRGFEWGENDCVLFGANWVQLLTGRDPLEGLRGRWKTERGAARVIASEGLPLDALVRNRLEGMGFAAVAPIRAHRGDIVVAFLETGLTVGIVADHRAAFLTADTERPYAFCEPRLCVAAWRVD